MAITDLSSATTVQFGKPLGSYNLSLSGGDGSGPGVYRYHKIRTAQISDVPGSNGLETSTTFTEYVEGLGSTAGWAEFRLDYDGPEPIRLEVIRGVGSIGGGYWTTDSSEMVIRFNDQNAFQVDTDAPPVILYTSEFRDQAGNLVEAPVWNGALSAFHHQQLVYGALIVTITKRHLTYVAYYSIDDYYMVDGADGFAEGRIGTAAAYSSHAAATGTTLPPLVVAAISPKNFAILSITRSVDARDETEVWTPGQKVEVSREGFVDRVFPTPPKAKPKPPKDAVTGRDDYMDVERTTKISYMTSYTDKNGHVQMLRSTESQHNQQPDNSYLRKSFYKNGNDATYKVLVDDRFQPFYEPPPPPELPPIQ